MNNISNDLNHTNSISNNSLLETRKTHQLTAQHASQHSAETKTQEQQPHSPKENSRTTIVQRTYALRATILRRGSDSDVDLGSQTSNIINPNRSISALCPVFVRQCFPRWQISKEDAWRVGRGVTSNGISLSFLALLMFLIRVYFMIDVGEFQVKVAIPRIAFINDEFAKISLQVNDGSCCVKSIASVKVILNEIAINKY
jgi:hypothetical protein